MGRHVGHRYREDIRVTMPSDALDMLEDVRRHYERRAMVELGYPVTMTRSEVMENAIRAAHAAIRRHK